MRLADDERAMLDGEQGEAVAAAMDLLVRYGEVLGAERLVDTDNVCGANLFGSRHSLVCGSPTPDGAFSEHSLDAPRELAIPPVQGAELPAHRADGHQALAGAGAAAGRARRDHGQRAVQRRARHPPAQHLHARTRSATCR